MQGEDLGFKNRTHVLYTHDKRAHDCIASTPITEEVGNGMKVTITWYPSFPGFYHSCNRYISDLAVHEHTDKMMHRFKLKVMAMSPLTIKQPLCQESKAPVLHG